MATYAFETISAAEALAFSAADALSVADPAFVGAMTSIRYQADGVLVSLGGRSVLFGAGLMGRAGVSFPDGSIAYVGGTGPDTAAGAAHPDALYGGLGDDSLSGAPGDDLLQGNQGRDSIFGGAGADVIYGGQGDDLIDLGSGPGFGQGNLGEDTVRAAADSGPATLLGGQGNDLLVGGGMADFLNGNLGADSLVGGAGADTLSGEGGGDTFAEQAGSSLAGAMGAFAGEAVDRILGWSAEDRIDKPGGLLPPPGTPGVDPSYYYEVSPASTIADADYYGPFGPPTPFDYFRARDECVRLMAQNPTLDVIAVESYEDVLVFIDADGGDAPDLAILLVGARLDEVGYDSFI